MSSIENLLDPFRIPEAILALSEEVSDFRVANRRALRNQGKLI